jgi:periplasmic protein TonB
LAPLPRRSERGEPKPLDVSGISSRRALPSPRLGLPRGFILSLLLHSLPLLGIISWRPAPAEVPTRIPVELVIEQPPPPPPPQPESRDNPLPIRGASADMAEMTAPKPQPGADAPLTPAEPAAPSETQTAAAAPPDPARSEEQTTPEPPPAETKTAALMPPPPKRAPKHQEMPPMPVPMASAWPLPLHRSPPQEAPRFASLTGPAAVRDEYCVRALNMTLRHLDVLPLSYLAGRRGRTMVTIRILGDGTINSVKLAQSSGYSDIDQRVQRMVFAVGQYPPLPPRLPGTWMDFTFSMVFPDPRQQ